MENPELLFAFLTTILGFGAVGYIATISRLSCDKKLSTQELRYEKKIQKIENERDQYMEKYNNIKSIETSKPDTDRSIFTKFIRIKNNPDSEESIDLIEDFFGLLIEDYLRKSYTILEDTYAQFDDKNDVLNTLGTLKDYIEFDSRLIKSLVFALVDSKRHQISEKIIHILKSINKPVVVCNTLIDYYPWAVHDSISYVIRLLKEIWDNVNLNRIDDLIDSLSLREEKVLKPLKDFRNEIGN